MAPGGFREGKLAKNVCKAALISLELAMRAKFLRALYSRDVNEASKAYNESLRWLGIGGHPCDDTRAFQLNERASSFGHLDAILAMGWFYLNGCGVARDLSLAENWYRRSARRGEARAMFSLGYISYNVIGYSDARRWFERATQHGHIRSYYWLGKLAWRGHGVSRDRSAAFALFHRAARGRDSEAVRALRFLSRRKCHA